MKNLAPIALFAYKRPEHLSRTLEALRANLLAKESELFVFSDAARAPSDEETVKSVRRIARAESGFKRVETIENAQNKGLAANISEGVTRLVEEYGKVIVLEDDIVVSPHFLSFMNDALDAYEDDHQVMHVNGYFFPGGESLPQTFFCNQMLCWGWATWKRAWDRFSFDTDRYISILESHPELRKKMYLRNALSTLRANKAGRARTWAAYWQAAVTEADGFCLTPRATLALNIGHDGSGEHDERTTMFASPLAKERIAVEKIPLEESQDAVLIGNRIWRKARGSFIVRVIRKLKSIR